MDDAATLWSEAVALTPGASSVGRARDFVGAQLERHGLLYLLDDVNLVVSELVTNAVVHARSPVVIAVQERGDHILVTVSDRSPHLPQLQEPGVTDVSARGLVIVDHCSCQWGFQPMSDGGKSVWASFAKATGPQR